MSEPKKHQWPTWWGGAVFSDEPPQIHQALLAIRKSVGGLKAKKEQGGPQFAVRKATDLVAKLRTALDKEGCHVYVVAQDVTTVDVSQIPPDQKGRVVRSAATVQTKVRVCAADGSYVEGVGCGGGADGDDKAVGKASTYSYKDALIKALTLPDADIVDTDDEDEVGVTPPPSPELQTALAAIRAAGSKADLKALVSEAKKLPLWEQRLASDAIQARLKELS